MIKNYSFDVFSRFPFEPGLRFFKRFSVKILTKSEYNSDIKRINTMIHKHLRTKSRYRVISVMKDCNKQPFHFKSVAKEIGFKFIILTLCYILLVEISQNRV